MPKSTKAARKASEPPPSFRALRAQMSWGTDGGMVFLHAHRAAWYSFAYTVYNPSCEGIFAKIPFLVQPPYYLLFPSLVALEMQIT